MQASSVRLSSAIHDMSKFDFFASDIKDADSFMKDQLRYKDLKRSELADMPENEIVGAVTAWIETSFKEDWSDMGEKLNSLPTPCLNIYCAEITLKQVINSGFSEAVFNLSNDFLGIAANGFRAVGYEKLAEIVDSAVKVGADKRPSGRSFVDFLEFSENVSFSSQDKDFRRCFEQTKFDRLAKQYILNYSKYFGNA